MSNLAMMLRAAAGNAAALPTLTNSLQFDRADEAYLSQTFSSGTARDKWTFSCWFKRLSTGVTPTQHIMAGVLDNDSFSVIRIDSSDRIEVSSSAGGSTTAYVYTQSSFTSTSDWYHLVVKFDLSLSSSIRIKIYIDGVDQTLTVGTAASNNVAQQFINAALPHQIGIRNRLGTTDNATDALLADVIFVDDQALTPGNFGYNNGGSWEWKSYTGTYGTNGFRLLFDDGTSTTTLGVDSSGNENNWTLNNLATSDQKTDIPA